MADDKGDDFDLKEFKQFVGLDGDLPPPPGFEPPASGGTGAWPSFEQASGAARGGYGGGAGGESWGEGGWRSGGGGGGWKDDWKDDGWKSSGGSGWGWSADDSGAAHAKGGGAEAPAGGGLTGEASALVRVEHADSQAFGSLLAAKSWDELNLPDEILRGIYQSGFVKPSKIQEWSLPIALKGGNMIGQAQNGSGKTAAFALSLLILTSADDAWPQAVMVSNTRELAAQNLEVAKTLGKHTRLEFFLCVAGTPAKKVDAQVISGTPGKIEDLIKQRKIASKGIKFLVFDEADVLLEDHSKSVLQIRNMLPDQLQVFLFSATFPERVKKFAENVAPQASRIFVQKEELTLDTITQTFVRINGARQKIQLLSDLYGTLTVGQSIIFVNSRNGAFALAKSMRDEGHAVSLICGTQEKGPETINAEYRDRVMSEFRSGVTRVLIATDVLSRGIDVPAVTLVVNYDMPNDYWGRGAYFETYMHRIGRTGRFGLTGMAVNFVSEKEMSMLEEIRSFYQCTIRELSGDGEELSAMLKEVR